MFLISLLFMFNMHSAEATSLYDYQAKTLDGETIDLSQYKGKKLLIVNTASKCGYTKQYKDLQALHELHGDKVVILGFPSDNFGGQEFDKDEQIANFCQKNYGVTFQLFSKIDVKGEKAHPIYKWLKEGANDQKPTWNFCKYLVNEKGEVEAFYPSKVKPMDEKILNFIKK